MRAFSLLCCALALVGSANAMKETLTIDNDSRHAFHIESFGFEAGGVIEIEIENFMLMIPADYKPPADANYNIAFVVQRSASDAGLRVDEFAQTCFHDHKLNEDDDFISLSSRHQWSNLKWSKTITEPGYYHIYFSNCEETTHSTFTMSFSEYNMVNGEKMFLSAGQASLPTWFFLLCLAFVVELFAWMNLMRKQKGEIKSIHWLMSAVVLLKICQLLFEALKFHSMKVNGENNGWAIMFYIFSGLKGLMMFSVIVLIGTGWSYLKPFLTDRDKQIMLAVLVAQAIVNIAMVVMDEESPGTSGWLTWRDILHLLDMICCCVILLPIVWSIRHLRTAAEADGKAARTIVRLKNFRTFYLVVVTYVYFTRIIVFLLGATLPFEITWLATIFSEVASLAFYATTGWLFRPQARNPYLAIGKDDDDHVPTAEMAAAGIV